MLPALILAAGASSRMGRPKALLPLSAGECFLSHIEATLRAAGVREVTAVVGYDAQAIRAWAAVHEPRLRLVENAEPSRGQLSSLVAGLDAVEAAGRVDAVLVTIVDVPLVTPATVQAVIDAWRSTAAPIVRPSCAGRHGHPVVFAASLFAELRRADPGIGARAVVRAHSAEIVDVAVDDTGAVDDIDTPDDYARIVGRPIDDRLR